MYMLQSYYFECMLSLYIIFFCMCAHFPVIPLVLSPSVLHHSECIHWTFGSVFFPSPCNHGMQVSFLSYYLTQCFQHIYFATSTLWGKEGQSVFGTDSIEFSGGTTSFRYKQIKCTSLYCVLCTMEFSPGEHITTIGTYTKIIIILLLLLCLLDTLSPLIAGHSCTLLEMILLVSQSMMLSCLGWL